MSFLNMKCSDTYIKVAYKHELLIEMMVFACLLHARLHRQTSNAVADITWTKAKRFNIEFSNNTQGK